MVRSPNDGRLIASPGLLDAPAFRCRFQYHLELRSPPPGAPRCGSRSWPAKPASSKRWSNGSSATPTERGARPVVTDYDLSLLNVESRFPIARIVDALRCRSHGCLCFHGAPGTGKTALTEHIARALQRPLLIRQASDLVSKFLGETEQNMARMFEEAENEQAVLLLDEADSFLRSRQRAQLQLSQVNEMLQGMERFAGILICTTNPFDELDEAARDASRSSSDSCR